MFGDTLQTQVKDQDLFGYLLTKFLTYCKEEKKEPDLMGYLEFGRRELTTNTPISIKYLSSGLGVQLRSGDVVGFTADQLGVRPMVDEGTSIIATKESIAISSKEQARAAPDTSISLADCCPARDTPITNPPPSGGNVTTTVVEEVVKQEDSKPKKPHHKK